MPVCLFSEIILWDVCFFHGTFRIIKVSGYKQPNKKETNSPFLGTPRGLRVGLDCENKPHPGNQIAFGRMFDCISKDH